MSFTIKNTAGVQEQSNYSQEGFDLAVKLNASARLPGLPNQTADYAEQQAWNTAHPDQQLGIASEPFTAEQRALPQFQQAYGAAAASQTTAPNPVTAPDTVYSTPNPTPASTPAAASTAPSTAQAQNTQTAEAALPDWHVNTPVRRQQVSSGMQSSALQDLQSAGRSVLY